MTGDTLTKIELSEREAFFFKKFMEHYDAFTMIYQSGVFEIKNGGAYLNFDSEGTLYEIKRNDVLYKRGFPIIIRTVI